MTNRFVTVLDGAHGPYVYGPFDDKDEATEFAAFLSAEVDPAQTVRLISPADELLGYWRNNRSTKEQPRNNEEVPF